MNEELIFSSCETKEVGSLGIQLPITIRPPGFVTRTISLATSKGLGANMAPKMDMVKSKRMIGDPLKVAGIPFLKLQACESSFRGALVARIDQVLSDVDASNVSP